MRNSILIVDDSEDTLELFQSTLEEQGFTVTTAKDPIQALELLKEHKFSLMLLDINMPTMNGFEMLAEMNKRELGQDTPVMLVSAVDNLSDLKVPRNVIDTLKKPFFYPELIHKIKKVHGFQAEPKPAVGDRHITAEI